MKQFFHSLFYLPKHEKLTDRSFMKIVISSVTGIILCCLCLVSLTWAWFEDGTQSNGVSITTATFWADLYIEKIDLPAENTDEEGDGVEEEDEGKPENPSENGDGGIVVMRSANPFVLASVPVIVIEDSSLQFPMSLRLEDGYKLKNLDVGEYKISVYPRGTAEKVGGYVVIKGEGMETLYTEQLMVGDEFVFTLSVDGSIEEYELFCIWGSLPVSAVEDNIIENELNKTESDDVSQSSEVISSAESEESSDVSSAEIEESADASSAESETENSEESADTISQESSEDTAEESSGEI